MLYGLILKFTIHKYYWFVFTVLSPFCEKHEIAFPQTCTNIF